MVAPELRIENRAVYLRKSIRTPDFSSESVLAKDSFQFVSLWLQRNCKEALPFWKQAENYYKASQQLPPISSPLTSYYCFLNATKALLKVKGVNFRELHGVSGQFDPSSKRSLSNEIVKVHSAGILKELSHYLRETESQTTHTLIDLLANLPFIHRAFRYTYSSQPEIFVPIFNPIYRKHPTRDKVWISFEIKGRFFDKRSFKTFPSAFEKENTDDKNGLFRSKKRANWCSSRATAMVKERAINDLRKLHQQVRLKLSYISAPQDLWYLKRKVATGAKIIDRYSLTIIMAIMHRLSELSRYDPKGLDSYLSGKENWLLTEFIQLSPGQFIDEIACEITSLEFRIPAVRPK